MSTSRTQTTTTSSSATAGPSRLGTPIDEDEDKILREALARVERVKARKAAEEAAARKVTEEAEKKRKAAQAAAARRQAARDARDQAVLARGQEDKIVEWRRKLAEAMTARSQGGTSTGEVSASPRRLVVEMSRLKNKGKGKAKAQDIDEDPDDSNDGNDDDDDEEDREPCERCRLKKIPCLKQAGKRSSVICKPCHDSKLLRRQEDDHTRLISMDTRMSLMGMREGPETAGLSMRTAERRRIVEESEEEEGEGEDREVEEMEMEKDGEGEEEDIIEEEMVLTEARLEKGKERVEE
ncbi:hypothetical protein F5879DRAFT_995662 [Lentinula edodes]|nr:hypothetical protein F5879DRAFT_995662 [Lentinula edodes]